MRAAKCPRYLVLHVGRPRECLRRVTVRAGGLRRAYSHHGPLEPRMSVYTAVIERCPDTGLLVGNVPGFPGAHSQGGTFEGAESQLGGSDRDAARGGQASSARVRRDTIRRVSC